MALNLDIEKRWTLRDVLDYADGHIHEDEWVDAGYSVDRVMIELMGTTCEFGH